MKRITIYLLSSLCLLFAPLCRAENCAWLNAATAGGLLGGEVTMQVVHTTAADTTCEFTLKRAGSIATLEIAVHTMAAVPHDFPAYVAMCGATTMPLRAVGNEAVECTLNPSPEQRSEQIISRVRDRAFLLKWTMPTVESGTPALSLDELHDRMRNVAEQVAGSLF